MHELGVGSGDRALRRAVPEQLLRALVREQQLARRGLGDDHAEWQLANQRGQALALAVRLLVERPVVERERDSAGDLRGELLQIVVGRRLGLPAEREGAERAPAYEHGRREHRADADALDGDSVLRAAIRGVREIDRRRDDLRLTRADRDSHWRVTREHRGIALEHERGLVHLRIRVDDHQPAHLVISHDVHDALVGQGGHDEIGQRPQRRIGLERAGELLADRGQQAQRSAPAPLSVEHACALQRVGALLAHRHCEFAAGVVEDVPAVEAESERADRLVADPQRHGRRRSAARSDVREEHLALALAEEDGQAVLDGRADRRAL